MARFVPSRNLPKDVLKASTQGRSQSARAAAAEARARAPVVSGAYRNGIRVQVNQGTGEVDLVDVDPLAVIKEYGTIDTPAHMTLSNAARRQGNLKGSAADLGGGLL